MWPEARRVPKTLLQVAGRPFADWQLGWLADAEITSVVYCIGFMGEQIREFVGDGRQWDLRVTYVDEGRELRGTAGALRLAADRGALEDRFLVLYGDSWLQVDPAEVFQASIHSKKPALMTIFENAGRWDASNVIFRDGVVERYAKGLDPTPSEMRWIDYGLSVFTRDLVLDRIPPGEKMDLAPVCSALADSGELAGWVAAERFYEIGSASGIVEAAALLSQRD
jgi:NDP-sugar pyrophosphorylase family protein